MIRQYRHELHPRTNGRAILFGHHSRGLGDMPQVMNDPRRQELAQRDSIAAASGVCGATLR